MRYCNKNMQFYCHLLIVSIVIEAASAANATASALNSDRKTLNADIKNKRQINQFLRTPGASASTPIGTEPQAFPLQLSHGIYSQQRLPLYTRRPIPITNQGTEDSEEQDPHHQQQQPQQSILPSYYNYVPDVEENDNSEAAQIDSRHLPVEPRNKFQIYQSTPARLQVSYPSVTPKQSTSAQALISEDEYLDLIQNADFAKNAKNSVSKAPYGYVTATPTTSIDNIYDYTTKSPFSSSEYKKYTSRTHIPSTAPSPLQNLQPQTSVQQTIRQPAHHYIAHPTQYATAGPLQEFGTSSFEGKETVRVNLKKYHESASKTKYDPARGQYHQEVSVKPTKKLSSTFKPSYQYATTPQIQISSSNQQSVVQSQPLHYQSVQQISQSGTKSKTSQLAQPQSQYSIIVPQSHAQENQAFYSADANNPFQSFLPQNERLVSNNFAQSFPQLAHLPSAPQQGDAKLNGGQPDFRIQYVHHVSPTPTPTPRPRYVSDNTPGQPLKYELYDPNGTVNIPKEIPPKIKLIAAPQHIHRPQYAEQPQFYKKIKVQPAAHVQYVPVRAQYHQPTSQSSQATPQAQSDLLIPIQPSRSTLFVGQSAGHVETVSPSSPEKLVQAIPSGHQTHSEPRKPPLPITSPKKPISQAEFQALIDAGYKVQAIPVPVPVPVSTDKYKQLQYQQQVQQQQQQQRQHHVQPAHNAATHHIAGHPVQHTRQATTHYIRYHPKQESEEGILTSYLKPLIDYIGGPSQ